ncbi:hypothetical protein CR513_48374, partial [Mucuna pruriens]
KSQLTGSSRKIAEQQGGKKRKIGELNEFERRLTSRDLKKLNGLERMLKGLVHSFSQVEKIVKDEDLNRHVGSETRQFARTHSSSGFGYLNEGQSILNFSMTYDFKI